MATSVVVCSPFNSVARAAALLSRARLRSQERAPLPSARSRRHKTGRHFSACREDHHIRYRCTCSSRPPSSKRRLSVSCAAGVDRNYSLQNAQMPPVFLAPPAYTIEKATRIEFPLDGCQNPRLPPPQPCCVALQTHASRSTRTSYFVQRVILGSCTMLRCIAFFLGGGVIGYIDISAASSISSRAHLQRGTSFLLVTAARELLAAALYADAVVWCSDQVRLACVTGRCYLDRSAAT